MIIVKNTKELEEKYDLNRISDDEQIMVTGGLAGKSKYNEERYFRRVTYPARQIKQIINQMKEIERAIPREWNDWQKAKYIYQVLGSNIGYNRNREQYANQQASNLSILLSKEGICAGYSLAFKEMMDRQSIECDYIRGIGINSRGKSEKHAWNILTINGVSIPIDLTWEVPRLQKGKSELEYFGTKREFLEQHIQDNDEKNYQLKCVSSQFVNSIDISNTVKEKNLSEEDKLAIVQRAIEETYNKFERNHGAIIAKKQVKKAIERYIKRKGKQVLLLETIWQGQG